jgi:alkyldihydroxyacetonephosphate synthase
MTEVVSEDAVVPGIDVAGSEAVGERTLHAADRWPLSSKWTDAEREAHLPSEVVRPRTTADVVEVLKRAATSGVPVVPYGAGSGVVGSVISDLKAISLDLSAMTDVISIDEEAGLVTVQAGKLAGELEHELNARGLRIPHYPQSLHIASIGGLVATRSSGTFSSKYGNIEDLVVAVEAVLADGTIVQTKVTPRASTGPNILQLLVGSEGTLAVITTVTLRLLPLAETTSYAGVAFERLDDALSAVRSIIDRGVRAAVIRVYDPIEAVNLYSKSGIEGEGRSLLILAFDGPEGVVKAEEAVAFSEADRFGGTQLGPEIGETWERTRFDASWFDRGNAPETGMADAIEVSATWPVLRRLRDRVVEALTPHTDTVYAHYSHFYTNGGSLYFIFTTSADSVGEARERYLAAWSAAMEIVLEVGASISHHHGVGVARDRWLARELGSSHELLQRIKHALDPDERLNPGKLGIGVPTESGAAR